MTCLEIQRFAERAVTEQNFRYYNELMLRILLDRDPHDDMIDEAEGAD